MTCLKHGKIALILSAVALASCDSDTDPVQPSVPTDKGIVAPEFAAASNSWTRRRGIPDGRRDMGAGVVKNASGEPIVYLLGGYDFDGQTRRVDAYNYSTDTWESKRALGGTLHSNGVGVIGGKLYQSGGYGPSGLTRRFFVYDPARDAFTRKADFPMTSTSGVTGVIAGKLYVLAGFGTSGVSRRFFRYDPATDRWTNLTPPPRAHADGAGGVIRGKFYVAGGKESNGGQYTDKLDVYDPATDRWKALAPMPEALPRRAGAVIQNRLYVIGGGGGQVHSYNPVTNTWQTRASLLGPRIELAAVGFVSRVGNPRILALGGTGDDDWPSSENQVYTP
jgi:N-acetylneuraminic acid mutarotase